MFFQFLIIFCNRAISQFKFSIPRERITYGEIVHALAGVSFRLKLLFFHQSVKLQKGAIAAVQILYFQVLGREGDQAGIDYFADKFGEVVDPDELQIFSDMAKPEIDARNAYLADMAKKSAEDAAKAKAIADNFAKTAEDAKRVSTIDPVEIAKEATGDGCPPGYAFDGQTCRPTGLTPPPTTSGGINPALILAAAAAAFFIGG